MKFQDKKSSDNLIKVDGDMHKFGEATRLSKKGKGRMDLIPANVAHRILNDAYENFYADGLMTTSKGDIMMSAYLDDTYARCIDTVINLVNYIYCDGNVCSDSTGMESYETHFCSFIRGFALMTLDLSKHYENGAEIYGVDNWKNGIPVVGGDEGGSFVDSMLRHLSQYVSAYEGGMMDNEFVFDSSDVVMYDGMLVFDYDKRCFYKWNEEELEWIPEEPHHIAAIWNACGALWTILKQREIESK